MRPPNAPARSSSIPPSPAIRKSSPTLPIPARSSSSPIRKSATTAPACEDNESTRPYIEGLVVREFSAIASNWRSDDEADTFLSASRIPVVSDLDTRAPGAPSAHPRRDARRALRRRRPDAAEAGRKGARHSHHGRPRSGQPRLHARALRVDQTGRALLPFRTRRAAARARDITWWPTISASSTTSCAAWCRWAAASPWCPR